MPRKSFKEPTDRPIRYKGVTVRVPLGLDKAGEEAYLAEVIDPIIESDEYQARKARTAAALQWRNDALSGVKQRAAERRKNGGPTDAELEAAEQGSEIAKQRLMAQYPDLSVEAAARLATKQERD